LTNNDIGLTYACSSISAKALAASLHSCHQAQETDGISVCLNNQKIKEVSKLGKAD